MKVKVFIISGLLAIFCIAQVWASNLDLDDQTSKANLIKLAPAQILEKNINETLESSHFLKETKLHIQLGGTSKSLREINLVIGFAIYDYINNLKNRNVPMPIVAILEKQMFKSRPSLRKAILESAQIN